MLKGAYDDISLQKALLEPDDLLTGGAIAPSEAEQEILNYVIRNQNNGERTSVEEIIRSFGRRPYGWHPMAILTLLSRLFRMGKVELRTSELLDARAAWEHLKNTRQHGSVRVRDLNLLLDQTGRYTFLEPLRPIVDKLSKLAAKDGNYLLNHLSEYEDELLTAKEDQISLIKAFMHGPQRTVYDDAIAPSCERSQPTFQIRSPLI